MSIAQSESGNRWNKPNNQNFSSGVFAGLLWRKWWNFRLFSEMLTAAAVFGFTEDGGSEDTYYEYDAFISYTDRDRPWVIEKLIPRLENLGNVKICLHERDFQVRE